jgi:hypothetical protein
VVDPGLRDHMQRVYGYMAGGLVLTGIIATLQQPPAFTNP